MSPIKKKKLNKLRNELDSLDNTLLKIIKKRTAIVKQVLKLKDYKYQIVDNKRIKIILNRIKKKSIKNKIDPKITNHIWKNMIKSYIDYERRNFKSKELFTMWGQFFFHKHLVFSSTWIVLFSF